MRSNLDFDVKISIRTAISAWLTFANHAHLVAVINPSGDVDFLAGGLAFKPGAAAVGAGLFDHFTASSAGGAGDNLHHLTKEGLLHLADFARTLTGLAGNRS